MVWKLVSDKSFTENERVDFLFLDCAAVDTERHLMLSTTSGHTRNARRWFVHRMTSDFAKMRDDRVSFRAYTLREAMERLNEPRIQRRLEKLIAGVPTTKD